MPRSGRTVSPPTSWNCRRRAGANARRYDWQCPMLLLRLSKIAMIAALAGLAFIVAYDNIVDYNSNYDVVRHVLSMDTTFPHNELMHRAIADEHIWTAAYAA